MTRESGPNRPTLDQLFPVESPAATAILEILRNDPERTWQGEELIAQTQMRPIEILTALARLTHAGVIDHPAVGGYRHRGSKSAATG